MGVKTTTMKSGWFEVGRMIRRLKNSDVLVGIPAPTTMRKGQPINNASLLFIHTHGSALRHIPPRPVLEPAIAANKDLITPHLASAARGVIDKQPLLAQQELERAGTVAANAAKRWFTDSQNNWPPNAPSTIASKGSDRPLIDTAQMRRSITSVVRVHG